jgi:DNA-binding CsgD family transcriptional regulator
MVEPVFPAEATLAILRPAVDASVGSFQRTDRRSGATSNVAEGCGPEAVAAFVERSRTHWREHPHMAAAARGDLSASTGQRATGGEQRWRNSPVRDFLVAVGGWDQILSLPLSGGPSEICGFSFGRSGRDFTDADVQLLTDVQPLLQAIERHARAMAHWTQQLAVPDDVRPPAARQAGLTARQVEVLVLLADGFTATSMARRLGCSPRTVHKHVENLYRTLGVGDRVSAVLEGQRRRILATPCPGPDRSERRVDPIGPPPPSCACARRADRT